jgi:DNA-binding NarL/FixJ family response regulator
MQTDFISPSKSELGRSKQNDRTIVLVVDDSQDTLTMLTDVLTFENLEVLTAKDGPRAIQLANEARPDVILMDAIMPGMDGFETCRILKSEVELSDIPIIFMTGQDDSDHVVKALEVGGVDFVSKPTSLPELIARMRVHLANARKAHSARHALDITGRKIVTVSNSGDIIWSTPQATKLFRENGIQSESGEKVPWVILSWLLGLKDNDPGLQGHQLDLSETGRSIILRYIGSTPEGDYLLAVSDQQNGSDERRLADFFDLTIRESEVLLWITHGKSNKEVAEILSLSPRTVNKHLEQIFTKLGVENRTAAATKTVRVLWQH